MRRPAPWPPIRALARARPRIPDRSTRPAGRLAPLLALLAGLAAGMAIAQPGADTGFSGGISLDPDEDVEAGAQRDEDTTTGSRDGSNGEWWQDQPEGAPLRLLHAGAFTNAPDGTPAIALLFSGPFRDNGSFDDYLAVYDRDGDPIAGRWRVAASERVLYFTLPSSGTYIVRIRAGLPDADQNRLPQSLSGPVYVP